MRRWMNMLLFALVMVAASGCMSTMARFGSDDSNDMLGVPRYVFSGTQGYAQMYWEMVYDDDFLGEATELKGILLPWIVVVSFVDLPLSFALDVVLLPYDLVMVMIKGNRGRLSTRKQYQKWRQYQKRQRQTEKNMPWEGDPAGAIQYSPNGRTCPRQMSERMTRE